jgi:hypothetical protein
MSSYPIVAEVAKTFGVSRNSAFFRYGWIFFRHTPFNVFSTDLASCRAVPLPNLAETVQVLDYLLAWDLAHFATAARRTRFQQPGSMARPLGSGRRIRPDSDPSHGRR